MLAQLQPAVRSDGTDTAVISLTGNGYFFPGAAEDSKDNIISEDSVAPWTSSAYFIRVFFYPQQKSSIEVALKLKLPGGNSTISIMLDSSGPEHYLTVTKKDDYIKLSAGSFQVNSAQYHCITIKGIRKTGAYFPSIESVIIYGRAAANLKYNTSHYRGAASTHLWYTLPADKGIAWFYNEITVPPGENATNAYYMTNGFSGGYMGIQLNTPTEKRIIFSIWSNYDTQDPKQIPAEYAVTLMKKGHEVYADQFGGEGSGGHSHFVFNWQQGQTYKLLVGARAAGDHTIYTAYYFAPENGQWQLLAQWDKSRTGGKLLSGLYSFVENFGPNGNDHFKALYGKQWICTDTGEWIEMTSCRFSTTAGPVKHPRFDYGAGVENNRFYMFTGGFKQMNNLPAGAYITRKANGKQPAIDLTALPDK